MGLSEQRACQIVGADRKMIRYQSQRAPDIALRTRLRDLTNECRRFGCRRLFILLRREGKPSRINRIYRVYRVLGRNPRHFDFRATDGTGTDHSNRTPRKAGHDRIRQWDGTDFKRDQ